MSEIKEEDVFKIWNDTLLKIRKQAKQEVWDYVFYHLPNDKYSREDLINLFREKENAVNFVNKLLGDDEK